ncbi:uncharacterized protein LOC134011007 isoform X2 [Osmerus eperlanus]|uniref:uncharacterized protein LOC134011007 isoform X2 n=1 Tax=Osmerus eperlanus TaxID=29151 RepID=UPI002E104EEE
MTTRVIASFNVLDEHSKKILAKHARNRLFSHTPRSSHGSRNEPDLPLCDSYDSDFDFPSSRRTPISKPKTKTEIINEEQELLHSKLRRVTPRSAKFSVPPPSITEDCCCRPENAINSRVSVLPFTCPGDVSWMRDDQRTEGLRKDQDSEGFIILTLKKRSTAAYRSANHPPQRLKWSREVEKVPPLEADSDVSKAMVGGVLGYTDTSHWCTSPSHQDTPLTAFTEQEEDQFSMSESVGKVVCQQLQRGNIVRVSTNRASRSREYPQNDAQREKPSAWGAEPAAVSVPLSLADELNRCVKLISPRPPSVYVPLPIVSETYPVVCTSELHPHEPFSSPSLHHLDLSENSAPCRTTVLSAIVRITDSLQTKTMVRRERERERLKAWPQKLFSGMYNVGLKTLSADGNISHDRDLGKVPLHSNQPPSSRGNHLFPLVAPPVPLTAPHRQTDDVGTVLNGVNPKQGNSGVHPPNDLRHHAHRTRKKLTTNLFTPSQHREPATWRNNKKDFLHISKPLRNTNTSRFVPKQQPYKERLIDQRQKCNNSMMSQVDDINNVGVYGVNLCASRPSSRVEYKYQVHCTGEVLPLLEASVGPPASSQLSDRYSEGSGTQTNRAVSARTDCTFISSSPYDPEQAVNIPTAECVDLL